MIQKLIFISRPALLLCYTGISRPFPEVELKSKIPLCPEMPPTDPSQPAHALLTSFPSATSSRPDDGDWNREFPIKFKKKDKIPNSITMKYALANIFFS